MAAAVPRLPASAEPCGIGSAGLHPRAAKKWCPLVRTCVSWACVRCVQACGDNVRVCVCVYVCVCALCASMWRQCARVRVRVRVRVCVVCKHVETMCACACVIRAQGQWHGCAGQPCKRSRGDSSAIKVRAHAHVCVHVCAYRCVEVQTCPSCVCVCVRAHALIQYAQGLACCILLLTCSQVGLPGPASTWERSNKIPKNNLAQYACCTRTQAES